MRFRGQQLFAGVGSGLVVFMEEHMQPRTLVKGQGLFYSRLWLQGIISESLKP